MRCSLLVQLMGLLSMFQVQAKRRNLTEITYRFTNCNSAQFNGPRVEDQCRPFYQHMNSRIVADPDTLFQFDSDTFRGAQGFRLPKDGLYNITIAGARGGEGICNFAYGKGSVVAFQVELSTDFEYLIMVGHRGTSVCAVPENANHPVCQQPRPTTLVEVDICREAWFNWTRVFSNANNRFNFNGGGGGGGASMIRPRRLNNQLEPTDLPIAIAPGGGGASAILNYQLLSITLANISGLRYPQSADSKSIYDYHVNGHLYPYNLGWEEGARGFRQSNTSLITSGAGGGWNTVLTLPLRKIDGELLSQQVNFAQGGTDCSSNLATSDADVFTGVFGGYGGGGGGCGSGGGGGGYTGGHVFGNINQFPGSGGEAVIFNHSESPLVLGQFSVNNGDGYVEIVSSNCECAGQCVVYFEEGQFECLCPNDTILAQDERSCYQEKTILIAEQEPLQFTSQGETVFITGLQFASNSSYSIYGLNVSLTVTPSHNNQLPLEDIVCAVMFVGRNLQSVLASNPIRVGTERVYKLINIGNDTTGLKKYTQFLENPVLTVGAVLISNGHCSLSSVFMVNISFESDIDLITEFEFGVIETFGNNQSVVDLIRFILGQQSPVIEGTETTSELPTAAIQATTMSIQQVSTGLIIGPVVAGSALLIILISTVSVYVYRRRQKKAAPVPIEPIILRMKNLGCGIPENSSPTEIDGHYYRKIFSCFLIPYQSITKGEIIGQGAFGKVYEGSFEKQGDEKAEDIAIKMVANPSSPSELKNFLDESLIMMNFCHPNILSLIGVCLDTPEGLPYIILPFMANGSLKHYLKRMRTHMTDIDTLPPDLSMADLVKMCMDIANGMEYLAGERFVHRDLAARNCMVDVSLAIKVGDFGLTRDIYTNEYYKANQGAKIPVKWMAPEALLDRINNHKTDVWSFGVTCWEVFSLGRTPYPDISNQEVLDHITKQNRRLERPSLCPQEMYDIAMSGCWRLVPEERPSFDQLVCELQEFWNDQFAYEV